MGLHDPTGQGVRVLARQEAVVAAGLRHLEMYTPEGLLSMLWHGEPGMDAVVLMCGGAAGSLLGPADGLYQDLGAALAERGIGTIRVGYRIPNDLDACTEDLLAAAVMALERGTQRFVTMGHSFGGAIAVMAAIDMPMHVVGTVTLATQSAGCESAMLLGGRPLLLLHGDRDRVLPVDTSAMVRMIAGDGELVVLPGAGHLLTEAADEVRRILLEWIPAVLGIAGHDARRV